MVRVAGETVNVDRTRASRIDAAPSTRPNPLTETATASRSRLPRATRPLVSFLDRFRRPRGPVWFTTFTGPFVHRCATCGEERSATAFRSEYPDHCELCLRTCIVCNAARLPTDFQTYDHPALSGRVCHDHHELTCEVCNHTKTADHFTAQLLAPDSFRTDYAISYEGTQAIRIRLRNSRCDSCAGQTLCTRCFTPVYPKHNHIHLDSFGWLVVRADVRHGKTYHVDRRYKLPSFCRSCENLQPLTSDELDALNALTRAPQPTDPTAPSSGLTLGFSPDAEPITLSDTDRTRHIYLIGGTGSGKSVTLTNLATQDLKAGRGFTVIDPHGDLVANPDPERGGLLYRVPPDQLDRVAYFDPTHDDAPSFNLLAADFEPSKLTTDLVAVFKMFFGDSWGHQMEHLLRNALLTLLADRHHEPHSFADLRRILVEPEYRTAIVNRAAPDYASFWREEFPQLTKDAARPILTRLGTLLVPGSIIKRVMSSTGNDLDVGRIMNSGGVLLVNLSKGALGEQPAKLLGGLIVTAITQAALARQSIPERDRTPHTLYCDEFQNFADLPSTKDILSEARKYQLRLVLAHQTMSQVDAALMENILSNVRTVLGFNVSPKDAGRLVQRMARTVYVHPDTNQRYDLAAERQRIARVLVPTLVTLPTDPDTQYLKRKADNVDLAAAFNFLTTTATVDPLTYRPPDAHTRDGKWKPWKQSNWPEAQDFQNLATCHAFAFRNVASSTCALTVPYPPAAPYMDNLDHWHARRAAATTPPPAEKKPDAAPPLTTSPAPATTPTAPPKPGDDFDEFLT
jgi:hypothetical protein